MGFLTDKAIGILERLLSLLYLCPLGKCFSATVKAKCYWAFAEPTLNQEAIITRISTDRYLSMETGLGL